ncbi:MAG: PSD1 and planctomycete cytochrome C domain-containing protein [Limisphaerales bacterium]
MTSDFRAWKPAMRWKSLGVALAVVLGVGATRAEDSVRFSRDVLPILSDHCFACHGPDAAARKGGLRLDVREGATGPGKSGKVALVPGDPKASEVVRRMLTPDPDDLMPPPESHRPLSQDQIATLTRWISEGAPWGRHWAYEPPRRPTPPSVPGTSNPIDAFVRSRLVREGLEPAPEASRETLLRRLTLDLTGLPPTPDEIREFVQDTRPGAYERQVDRLLASPRHGERLAWDWLEAARYADSNGYQGDGERTMWPWRDWVVREFNANRSFDQFTTWQLAGDLLPSPTPEQRLATGFVRNHMINGEGGRIAEENRIDYLFDQTETVATVWLGATFNCTRCHDHKFDPFTQKDYFGLLAFFDRTVVDGGGGDPQSRPNLEWPSEAQKDRRQQIDSEVKLIAQSVRTLEAVKFPRQDGRPVTESPAVRDLAKEIQEALAQDPEQRDGGRLNQLATHWRTNDAPYAGMLERQKRLRDERDGLNRSIPRVMVMADQEKFRDTFILARGNYQQPGAQVRAAVPQGLSTPPAGAPTNRLGLAQWLLSPEQPLTARVAVNRSWQLFFGLGLVKTSEDFGLQGERPSHPELLDWMAVEFRDSGWDLKHLHRLIVTSATYRQSSRTPPETRERDPENRLLARGPRLRMPSWMIRDAALFHAGLLVEDIGGPPVKPYQPSGIWEEATFGTKRYEQDHGASLYRRSLYVFWRRIVGPTLFFDVASRQTCTVRTPRTNVPLHALLTLNDITYVEAARALAVRVATSGASDIDRLRWLYQEVVGRLPDTAEQDRLLESLRRYQQRFTAEPERAQELVGIGEVRIPTSLDPASQAAWTVVCSTVLNLDEALNVE